MIDINEIEKLIYIKNNQQYCCSAFVNNLTPDHYGIQRFITEDGDICILYLLRDGIPEGYKDVEQIYLEVMKKRKQIKKFEGSWVGINDAIRYFADTTPKGSFWYWGRMDIYSEVLRNNYPLMGKEIFTANSISMSFDNWFKLSSNKKIEAINYLLDNPVRGRSAIQQSIYEII